MFGETTNFIFSGSVFFWGVIFAAIAVGLTLLVMWTRRNNVETKWWDWLLGSVGLALLVFTAQNALGSLEEAEPTAAVMFLLVTGIPSLILLAVPIQFVRRRSRSAA